MSRPAFKNEGDFEEYCDKVERERDLWRTALRRELEGSYSPAESKRRVHKHQQYIDQEVEHERASGKSVETESSGVDPERGEDVLDGVEES